MMLMSHATLSLPSQNDFITGSLAVKDAETLVDPINALVRSGQFDVVVFSRDSHPKDHISFASTHPGQAAFTSIQLPNPVVSSTRNPGSSSPTVITQELWPDHCITGTPGWAFHPLLDTAAADIVVDKGQRKDLDSYSAFYKATDGDEESVLGKSLRDRGVAAVYSVGLAYDYCVGSTAIDAAREGFDVS
jgi:nicotinamidase/pyrazinamidase